MLQNYTSLDNMKNKVSVCKEKAIVQRSYFDENNKLVILDAPIIRQAGNTIPNTKKATDSKLSILDVLKPLSAYNLLVGRDSQGLYTIKHYGHVITYIAETKVGCSIYTKINGNWRASPFVEKDKLYNKINELTAEIKKQQNNGFKPIAELIKEMVIN